MGDVKPCRAGSRHYILTSWSPSRNKYSACSCTSSSCYWKCQYSNLTIRPANKGGWCRRPNSHNKIPGRWHVGYSSSCGGCGSTRKNDNCIWWSNTTVGTTTNQSGSRYWSATDSPTRHKDGYYSSRWSHSYDWGTNSSTCIPRGNPTETRDGHHWPRWKTDYPAETRSWWRTTSDSNLGEDKSGNASSNNAQRTAASCKWSRAADCTGWTRETDTSGSTIVKLVNAQGQPVGQLNKSGAQQV